MAWIVTIAKISSAYAASKGMQYPCASTWSALVATGLWRPVAKGCPTIASFPKKLVRLCGL